MGQLASVYRASSDYLATCVQAELAAHGIGSVVLHNEIPLHTGFTFGAQPWAEVLVTGEDLAAAGEIVAEVDGSLIAADSADPYSPAISVRTALWFSLLCLGMLILVGLVGFIREYYDLFDESYAWINPFILSIAAGVAIATGFFVLNSRKITGTVVTALLGLLAVPVFVGWLAWQVVLAVLRGLLGDLISLGRPDSPTDTGPAEVR